MWAIWCLLLPLYNLLHFLLLIAVTVIVGIVFGKLFPGKIEYVEVPAEPVTTGDDKCDALLREGERATAEMKRLQSEMKSPEIRAKIARLEELTGRIFGDLTEDKSDYPQVKRFSEYYLPTTLKLLSSYAQLEKQNISGENISGTMQKINDVLDTTVSAYEKQLDALFADQALDIETDITVLESMLKREGLSGGDFKQTERN